MHGAVLTFASMKSRTLAIAIATAAFAAPAAVHAHHGFGQFDRSKPVDLTGVITGIDFVNPHSYLRFDTENVAGETVAMRCEMRAATLLRRSGWSKEMFVVGATVSIQGFGHRTDDGGMADHLHRVAQPLHTGAGDEDRPFECVCWRTVELEGDGGEQAVFRCHPLGPGVQKRKTSGAVC